MALFPLSGKTESATDIIKRATMALDRAKEADGSGTVFIDAEWRQGHGPYQTEMELRRALKLGELRLFLQSQFTGSGECVGAEILLR